MARYTRSVPTVHLSLAAASPQHPVTDSETGAGGAAGSTEGTSAAAPSGASATGAVRASAPASGSALALFAVAALIAAGLLGTSWGPTYTPAVGVGSFALFYVAAQAAERLVEMAMPLIGRISALDKATKIDKRDTAVATANNNGDVSSANEAANAQAEVDQATANRTVVAFAATAAVGMLLCAVLEADFLGALGVAFGTTGYPGHLLTTGVTGLVVGGGSAGLHDLISNLSKSSDAKSTPSETGGAA